MFNVAEIKTEEVNPYIGEGRGSLDSESLKFRNLKDLLTLATRVVENTEPEFLDKRLDAITTLNPTGAQKYERRRQNLTEADQELLNLMVSGDLLPRFLGGHGTEYKTFAAFVGYGLLESMPVLVDESKAGKNYMNQDPYRVTRYKPELLMYEKEIDYETNELVIRLNVRTPPVARDGKMPAYEPNSGAEYEKWYDAFANPHPYKVGMVLRIPRDPEKVGELIVAWEKSLDKIDEARKTISPKQSH